MNTAVAAPLGSCHHPRRLPPLSITRFVAFLVDRWDAWRERSAQRRALEALSRLDAATLRDLGLEESYSHAAALRDARARYEAGDSAVGRLCAW